MQADYKVNSIYVDEETGEIFAKCYDNVYGEDFEKYLGNPEEHQSSLNASIMLEDSNFGMTDELRNEIISTFGLEDLGHEFVDTDDYDDEIYAGNANGIMTEEELDAQYNIEESFSLREALNRIDIATSNKFDLRNLYESVELSEEDKKQLATLIYDQEDASVIYDTLNGKFLESIGMNEEDETKSPVIHKKSDGSYLVTSESGDGYTAFNKNDVCMGHISAHDDNEAKNRFNINKFDESLNKAAELKWNDVSDEFDDPYKLIYQSKKHGKIFNIWRDSEEGTFDVTVEEGSYERQDLDNSGFKSLDAAKEYCQDIFLKMDESLNEYLFEIPSDYIDYCPKCSERELTHKGDGKGVCDSCGAEFTLVPGANNQVKILPNDESDEYTKLTESSDITWHDVYKQFLDIVDSTYTGGNEEEIAKAVEELYRQHDGETAWDEAWLRWLDHTLEPGDEGFEEADALYKSERERIRGRKLGESTSSRKTFAQWFDETQCYGDDTEFYPFDNYVKNFPNAEVLRNVTALDIVNNAHKFHDIYDVDSDDRMKAFIFACEELNIDEDILYKAWLRETPIACVNESLDNNSWDTSRVTDLVSHYLTEFDNMSTEQLQKKIWVTMKEEGSKLPDLDTFKQYVADTAAHFYEEVDSLGEDYELSPKNEDINDPDEVLTFKRDINLANDADEIQQLIYELSDGVAEDNAQQAFNENESNDLETLKSAVVTAIDVYLEDNEWLGESKSIEESFHKDGWVLRYDNGDHYVYWTADDDYTPDITNPKIMIYDSEDIALSDVSDVKKIYAELTDYEDAIFEPVHTSELSTNESKSIKEGVEYEVYFDSGLSDEDEFFTDLRQAKKYAKELVKKYGPKESDTPAIIKKNNGDPLPDNWNVIDKIYYNNESRSIRENEDEEKLTAGKLTRLVKNITGLNTLKTQSTSVRGFHSIGEGSFKVTKEGYNNFRIIFYRDKDMQKKVKDELLSKGYTVTDMGNDIVVDAYKSQNESKPINESADTMIYLFPELTDEDLDMLKAYGLQLLGINHGAYGDEENWVVRGQESSLRMFADKYLGYELHPDYLYDEDDFAGDIEPLNEALHPSGTENLRGLMKNFSNKLKQHFYQTGDGWEVNYEEKVHNYAMGADVYHIITITLDNELIAEFLCGKSVGDRYESYRVKIMSDINNSNFDEYSGTSYESMIDDIKKVNIPIFNGFNFNSITSK